MDGWMWMSAVAALRTFASGPGASLWFAYAGVLVALGAAVFLAAAVAASAPPRRMMIPGLLVVCGAGVAATASASDQWWPLILTLHLAAAAVLTGYGLRYQRVNRPQREP